MQTKHIYSRWMVLPVVALALVFQVPLDSARAADELFVGRLAIAVQPEVVKRLGLSEEVLQKLNKLIDEREQEALNIALELKELPPQEKEARLAPFIAESEKRGLVLLTPEQRVALDMIRIGQKGMSTLAEPEIAKSVGLNAEQQQKVAALLDQRAKEIGVGSERERRAVRDNYERQLVELLTREQKGNWEKLAGMVPGDAPAVAPATPPAVTPAVVPLVKPVMPEAAPGTALPKIVAQPTEESLEELPPENVKLKFNFQYAPYKDVLEWFAQQAGLSLQLEVVPPGTFNYRDPRTYTAAQGIDILNRALLTKGYTVLRHGRMMTVINLEDKFIPDALLEIVPVEQLDERGEFEITRCVFDLAKLKSEEVELEIRKLLGPTGDVRSLSQSRQVMVTETGGRLRAIRTMLKRIDDPEANRESKITEFVLKNIAPDEFMLTARELLGLAANQNSSTDIRISVDSFGSRLFATGTPESVQKLKEIVELLDRSPSDLASSSAAAREQPQLETYFVQAADPAMTLKVVQTLLAGLPDVRIDIDTVSGRLIALARPSEHKVIIETLKMLEGQVSQFEIIPLRRSDPTLVLATINKFFGSDPKTKGDAPIVDADLASMKLYVRGTQAQLAQIRSLVEKLEGGGSSQTSARSNVRVIPLGGEMSEDILRQAERMWSGSSPIQIISPAQRTGIIKQKTIVPPREGASGQPEAGPFEGLFREGLPPRGGEDAAPPRPAQPPENPPSTRTQPDRTHFVNQVEAAVAPSEQPAEVAAPNLPGATPPPDGAQPKPSSDQATPGKAAIRVTVVPGGILVACDDPDVLDDFEDLIRTLSGAGGAGMQPEYTVFYLRYAKAEVAQMLVMDMLGGSGSSSGGGGSVLGSMTSGLFGGGLLGGMMGNMLGGGGGGGEEAGAQTIQASGQVRIIADPRLNALIVYANSHDAAIVEQLLKVVDQEGGLTNIETEGAPRIIPLEFISADEAAETVKSAFANRIAAAAGQRSQQQPSPEEFIRALRGGGGGGRSREQRGELAKMTVAADRRNNALIVTAPEPLFQEVQELVRKIDTQGTEASEATSVYSLRFSKADHVQKTLSALLGANAKTRSSSGSSGGGTPSPGGGPPGFSPEMFQRMREGMMRGESGGGDRGGGDRGGGDRGGGDRGGGSRGFGGFRGGGGGGR